MAKIIKLGILLPIFLVVSVSACGGAFDGQWQINEEISMADCMDWAKSNAQNTDQESNAMLTKMMEGFSNRICEGFVSEMAPEINIKNNKMTLRAFENEAKCIVHPEANVFTCNNENSENKEGTIHVVDGQLIWGLPPKPEKMSLKFT